MAVAHSAASEYPPDGLEVVVTLADNSAQVIAYWNGSEWYQGVEGNPNDTPLVYLVKSWTWRIG